MDLAWGERNPTGLAVLDGDGRLLAVSTVITDDEVVEALKPYTEGDCLVAIDAPLVVTNATGNRAAEAALNKDFAPFDAGAHPTNTARAEFTGRPRGARIASQLGLDMNPRSGRARRAIEVYPHPATVALFRLGRTLKYKSKSGRSLEQLRAELLVLLGLIESLQSADPRLQLDSEASDGAWRRLRTAVEVAQRKSELRLAEDQVDAVLCAYIALFATSHPERTTTYGTFEQGYIVTPTLPADLVPTRRSQGSEPELADDAELDLRSADPGTAVRRYAEQLPEVRRATADYVEIVRSMLDDAGINYLTVTGRAKTLTSFAAKAARTVDGRPVHTDPLSEILDQIGLRVITYVHSDVQAVVDVLNEQLVVHDDRDMGEETASEGRFGYASRHLHVELETDDEQTHPHLAGRVAQVQVRTVLQHAWAEFEHDIRYKGTIPDEHVPDFDRRFTLAAGLLELADREFSTIRERLTESMAEPEPSLDTSADPRITARELAAFLAGQYADAGWSRTDHYEWIGGLLLELGITSLVELGELLRSIDSDTIVERMGYRHPPTAVRRLDDALLWAHGDDYVALSANAHRVEALRTRLAKMRQES
ncbi:DUF429 domain-containing protein [Nocardioides jishulii]|uniref:DUF429 domain-containing protein n=1 Tax=Nocardioides jishulii TaxID=2575440 RepID=UPI001EF05AB8|nr:DUF429 domain-containing protein [Nocardioides jishulii]